MLAKAPLLRVTGYLVALLALGLGATLDSAPATSENPKPATESASLPNGTDTNADLDAALPPDITLDRTVQRGDTLSAILTRAGADNDDTHLVIQALRKVMNVRALMPGDEVTMTFERLRRYQTGRLLSIELPRDAGYTVRASRVDDDDFKASKVKRELSKKLVRAAGSIDSNFYLAGSKAGLGAETMAELIKLFAYDVDFQRDVQPGDTFDVLYQRVTDEDGDFVRRGDIVYAALTLSDVRHAVYGFRTPGASSIEYYDAKGKSVRKTLLRTPLDAIRITSRFGNRKHPIRGYTRMHRGVDFGAPPGTPIYAAGNGRVEEARRKGGYGLYVRLRHDGQFETAYAHMRAFAKGIRRGAAVHQGQIIGYVGATGEATGPHLHYEVIRSGHQVNPLGIKFAGGGALSGRDLKEFAAARDQIDRRLATGEATTKIGQR